MATVVVSINPQGGYTRDGYNMFRRAYSSFHHLKEVCPQDVNTHRPESRADFMNFCDALRGAQPGHLWSVKTCVKDAPADMTFVEGSTAQCFPVRGRRGVLRARAGAGSGR